MTQIGWDETAPSDTTTASLGDNAIRSLQSNLAGGLGTEMYWPGSGGGSAASAGEAKPGMLRFARTSQITGGHQDGFLAIDPTRVALRYIGSAWTGLLGHAAMHDHASSNWTLETGIPSFPQTSRWLVQEGTIVSSLSTGESIVTFPTAYGRHPVFIGITSSSTQVAANPRAGFSATTFSSLWSAFVDSPSTFTLTWFSEGTASLG